MSLFADLKLLCPPLALPGEAAAETLATNPLLAQRNMALLVEYLIRAM